VLIQYQYVTEKLKIYNSIVLSTALLCWAH